MNTRKLLAIVVAGLVVMAQAADRMTNRVAADRILREWATLRATHRGDVQASD
ncbi:hypothetical protein NOR53_2553 [gamma proteobacterium NOR5-3]|nr:hypothetical protein NOR53_2553 [gamma proteobacterium NOR5-3]